MFVSLLVGDNRFSPYKDAIGLKRWNFVYQSVIIILGIMAFGLCANVFAPALNVKPAWAQLSSNPTITLKHSGHINPGY